MDGRAQLRSSRPTAPPGKIEGLTLRTYNAQTHQWSLYWANSKNGTMDPPQVGKFKNGRGEFYAMDKLEGRPILVRFVCRSHDQQAAFEQSFSDSGGKTWEVNWITDPDARGIYVQSAR